jgi:hypothetical protein
VWLRYRMYFLLGELGACLYATCAIGG